MHRDALVAHLDALLDPTRMPDHGPNGLQVEGREEVRRIVTAVTASKNAIDQAVAAKADALIVHHGVLWDGAAARPLVGWHAARIRTLFANGINLIAYHLPLDVHPQHGNNAQLLARLGLTASGRFGTDGIGVLARYPRPLGVHDVLGGLAEALGATPTHLGVEGRDVRTVGVVTGAGQKQFEAAIEAGCDLFITGEASEAVTHLARETGVHYVWAGHHATEKGGVQAVGAHLRETFGVDVRFVDDANPV